MKKILFPVIFVVLIGGYFLSLQSRKNPTPLPIISPKQNTRKVTESSPLAIRVMQQKQYPGSDLVIEQTLSASSNYHRYLVSYQSDGLKQYGLLTVPNGTKPSAGWPVIIFNHGYIPPAQYKTNSSYAIMVDPLASAGYIVFKPDYRGNGNSE